MFQRKKLENNINRLLTWADFRNCNIFVRKINCVVATNGGPWSEDLRWIKEIVNEQIIQTMKFEIPNGGCTPLATRKPHRTTKHAIEKQTEWAQAAFIYCNDTKKYPMAQKKTKQKSSFNICINCHLVGNGANWMITTIP